MSGILAGRVVVITGAGRGLGRCHALEFARQGASVVVNDLGGAVDGTGADVGAAASVVKEIKEMGGEAVANGEDISDFDGAGRLIQFAIERYGDLHVLVNNAGILRDRMIFNMSIEEWDAVIRVHLRGTFSPLRHASEYWRNLAKAGNDVDARVINTTSSSGIYGNPGQGNYGAAKAGIAALTVIAARELERYGIAVNAIAPAALTRMTENLGMGRSRPAAGAFDAADPDNVAPLVVWLATPAAKGITGRVFNARGGMISVAQGWHALPAVDKGARWEVSELDAVVPELVANAPENALTSGLIPDKEA